MAHMIRLDGESLRFASAHFATFDDDLEPLHGHNYKAIVELSGSLSEDSWVLDFGQGKRLVRDVCKQLDHRFLLQAESRALTSAQDNGYWTIEFRSRRYVMPVGDVVALPVDNTTAERIAEWFAARLADALKAAGYSGIDSLRVGIEEAPGQSGWFSVRLT